MAPLKNPTTFQDQVTLLQNKRIIIPDASQCIELLSTANYYRLSGYLLPFMQSGSSTCFMDVEFDRLLNIYRFDAELRNLISFAIEKIEIYLRTQFAYYSAHHYGAAGYMSSASYNSRHNHAMFLSKINQCISENSNTLVVRHHMNKYNGQFPIWVIVDFFSIGMLSYFYRGMKNNDKANLAQSMYGVNYQTLESWMRCITDLRNKCAHYSRLYYWVFPAIPRMPSNTAYVPTRRLFAQLYMLKLMYPYPDKWNDDFVKPLEKIIQKYKTHISLNHIDFPYRWKSILKIWW